MEKQSKIEKYGCQEIVAAGIRADKSYREIAAECSDWAGVSISHTTVKRYIESLGEQKKDVITNNPSGIPAIVHQEFDIIQTTLTMAHKLMERFDFIDNMPEYFEGRMQELEHKVVENYGADPEYLANWSAAMNQELRRKVYEIATISKEMREYMKFLVELREKVFQFDLVQEYIGIFMDVFQAEDVKAFERALTKIAANPRMAQIVEQQRLYKGGDA